MAQVGTDLSRAAQHVLAGELVAIPTETVYGLAANGLDRDAVLRIFAAKERPQFNPLILHVPNLEAVHDLVTDFPAPARKLAEAFWPGPLTLLLPRSERVPDVVTAGSARVAVRVPQHPLTLELLKQVACPLAAPSANPFGYISPTTAAHVEAQLGERIPYILDGGEATVGVESTIVGEEPDGSMRLYRPGGIPLEALQEIVGEIRSAASANQAAPATPGRLASHYAPRAEVLIGSIPELLQKHGGQEVGILSFQSAYVLPNGGFQEVLSRSGDLHEAARHFFGALRRLDETGVSRILAEPVPEEGLGRAINDRLQRAAADR